MGDGHTIWHLDCHVYIGSVDRDGIHAFHLPDIDNFIQSRRSTRQRLFFGRHVNGREAHLSNHAGRCGRGFPPRVSGPVLVARSPGNAIRQRILLLVDPVVWHSVTDLLLQRKFVLNLGDFNIGVRA